MAVVVAELLALLKLDKKDFDKNMKSAGKDLGSFTDSIKKAGSKISDMGNKLTMATAPLALGLGAAVHEAHQFDLSMANINAVLGITGDEAADLRKELLAFGGDTRQGPQAIAEAFYEIVGGVADASTHMAILEAAVNTADAGAADLTATTSALISTMNSYGFAAEDAAHVSDVFTATVGAGVLSMEELAAAFPQVTGLGASLGLAIEDLGSQMAFLTAQGFSASQAATFMKSMMTTLLAPTADLETAITALGYSSGEAMINQLGLVGSYEALKQYNNGTFAGLITNQEALMGATALTKDTYDEFNTTFQGTIDGATDAAAAIQNEQASFDMLGSKLQETAITIGDQLTPVIIDLIDNAILPVITSIVDWATQNPELFRTIVMITGALVVAGPVLSAVGTAIGVISAALSPLGLALILGATLVAAYINNWGGFKDFVDGTVRPAIDSIYNGIQRLIGALRTGIELLQDITSGKYNVGEVISSAGKAVMKEMGVSAGTADSVGNVFNPLTTGTPLSGMGPQMNLLGTMFQMGATMKKPEGRAIGGGVSANTPYMVGEDGPELFMPDSSGAIAPNGGGGSPIINIYQQPGESGVALADRISREMVRMGVRRSA